jgi:hypothetical protein
VGRALAATVARAHADWQVLHVLGELMADRGRSRRSLAPSAT